MASYVVMEPPESGGEKTAEAKFVRDGFVVPALIIPVLWMLWHRMWLEAGLVFLVVMALGAVGERTECGILAAVLSFATVVFTGFEGANLRLASLRRKGWRDAAVIEAQSPKDAEIRYLFDAEDDVSTDGVPPPGLPWSSAPAAGVSTVPAGPALGLMSYPGRH